MPADVDAVVLQFEGTVQRGERLVLRASALLDRAAKTIGAAPVCGEEREERVRHLEWAIDAGQKALQAAASVRLDTEMSQGSNRPAARSLRDRVMSTSQSLPTRGVHRRGGRGWVSADSSPARSSLALPVQALGVLRHGRYGQQRRAGSAAQLDGVGTCQQVVHGSTQAPGG